MFYDNEKNKKEIKKWILKKVDEKAEENIPDNNFNISFYNKLKEYFNPLEIIL